VKIYKRNHHHNRRKTWLAYVIAFPVLENNFELRHNASPIWINNVAAILIGFGSDTTYAQA
jgi:hypothetical protein